MKTKNKYALVVLGILIISSISLFSKQLNSTEKPKQTNVVTISGIISDISGNSLTGVVIRIADSVNETTSGIDGKYSIQAKTGDHIEYFLTGYKSQSKKINKSGTVNITLEQEQEIYELVEMEAPNLKDYSTSKMKRNIAANSPKPSTWIIAASSSVSYDYNHNEEYTNYKENKFISPLDEALSTFSIDVDGASYSNFRRMINQGQLPTKDAVRIEEFVNYFTYNYDKPTIKDPVRFTSEIGNCPWNEESRLLRIGIKAKEIAKEKLPPSNLVFLIDISGSMWGPTRLELVKASMKLLTNNLRKNDRVAIVTYAGNAGLVLPSTSGDNKEAINEALDRLTAGGSTAGAAGIELAYKIAKENFIKGGNNRVIMCSDGDFNVGVSDKDGLEGLIEKERKSGIFLSVLGYGMGNYKDAKMQILAENGNGNASYIDNFQEANRVLVEEFGGTLFTVAKDVKLQIEFNPAKVEAYRLVGYESRLLNKEDFNDDTKDAGEMGAGHTVTAFYEIIPKGAGYKKDGSVDDLKYQKNITVAKKVTLYNSDELCTIKLRYKQPDGNRSMKLEIPVIDNGKNNVSSDMKFASAVAMFAQILKDSDFKGSGTYSDVIALAKAGLENDDNGYRREFVRLVEMTKNLK